LKNMMVWNGLRRNIKFGVRKMIEVTTWLWVILWMCVGFTTYTIIHTIKEMLK